MGTDIRRPVQTIERPGADLTRRSLIAAATVLMSAAVADKASAQACPEPAKNPACRCFLTGTPIRTPGGDRLVETLRSGDLVTTVSGVAKPVKWLARRKLSRDANGAWPSKHMPIRISTSAIDDQIPARDVYLSPAHMLFIDGYLIDVASLINGVTIVRGSQSDFDEITYYHIELESHDVVLAAGLPAETLRPGSFDDFDNAAERKALDLTIRMSMSEPYAPMIGFNGARSELKSLLRSAVAPLVDRRRPVDITRDRLADRADRVAAH